MERSLPGNLNDARSLLEALLHTTTDGVLVVEYSGAIVLYNQRFQEIWQIPESVMAARDDTKALSFVSEQLVAPEQFLAKVRELYREPRSESFDLLSFKDGRTLERWSHSYPITGKSDGRVWIFRDVSDKKHLEEEIGRRIRIERELLEAYRVVDAILDNIPIPVFVKEAKGLTYIRFNKAVQALSGYSDREVIGRTDHEIFPKHIADAFIAADHKTLASGERIDIPEEKLHTRFHGERLVHTLKIPVTVNGEHPGCLLGISEDLTQKKAAEELRQKFMQESIALSEMEKAVRLRNDFISIAAHELRTPLTSLAINVQLLHKIIRTKLSDEVAGIPEVSDLLHRAEDQVERLSRRMTLLLDVSRIRSEKLVLEREQIDLATLARQVAQRLEQDAKQNDSEIRLNLASPVVGYWDPIRIEQIVENLLGNAIQYGAGKHIELTVQTHEECARLTVRDFGAGIPVEDQERIFDRFERAISTRTFAGLGLGLWITKQIVTAHQGTIRLESEPGKGSTFSVELPLRADLEG